MEIKVIEKNISTDDLKQIAKQGFGDMVKIVVDINQEIMAIGGELHADAEEVLLEYGSVQKNLWGANIYPFKSDKDFIEYISLINIRPSQGNYDMKVQNTDIQDKIKMVVNKLISGESK